MAYRDTLPKEILDLCAKVTAKRAKTVIDHILEHGQITTEDLKNTYGYDHPPRAVRDVRENGIPLETFTVVSSTTGRPIAAYRFDDPSKIVGGRIGGRSAFSKDFKKVLIAKYDSRNTITSEKLDERYLQIDHRIPYEVAGDDVQHAGDPDAYMLLDASSQRAKSWSCENCPNFQPTMRNVEICRTCFWAFPENYSHVATVRKRRADIVWSGDEVEEFDRLHAMASTENVPLSDFLKSLISKALGN